MSRTFSLPTYKDNANKFLRVNWTENNIEWIAWWAWDIWGSWTTRTNWATWTCIGQGRTLISWVQWVATISSRQLIMTDVATVDTTVDNAFDVTYKWSAASASNNLRATNATLELIY